MEAAINPAKWNTHSLLAMTVGVYPSPGCMVGMNTG